MKEFFDIEKIKAIPITDVLTNVYGIEVKQKGNKFWCDIRGEKTASCCIYPNNSWCDFGDGNKTGNVIHIVQKLSNCDTYSAMKLLADTYHIESKNRVQNSKDKKQLADYEWRKIGIYPEMVSKNLDIDIDKFGLAAAMKFADNHRMAVNEWRGKEPKLYHKMLRDRVLFELDIDRDWYYQSLLSNYAFYCNFFDEAKSKSAITTDNELAEVAEELNQKYALLQKAVDDISLLKVPNVHLNPQKDLEGILEGSIKFQMGTMRYFEVCKLSHLMKESVFFVTIKSTNSFYQTKSQTEKLQKIPCAFFCKKDENIICTLRSELPKIQKIFGDEITNIRQKDSPNETSSQSKSKEISVKEQNFFKQ